MFRVTGSTEYDVSDCSRGPFSLMRCLALSLFTWEQSKGGTYGGEKDMYEEDKADRGWEEQRGD